MAQINIMKELRLVWEPKNKTLLDLIEQRVDHYIKGKSGGVSILGNGTLVFTPNGRDDELDAQKAMQEAKFLTNFKVVKMKDGDYLVQFHSIIAVFVGEDEVKLMKNEIKKRIRDLKFPGEVFMQEKPKEANDLMIGLYGRGKLQYDVHNFSFYKRIR